MWIGFEVLYVLVSYMVIVFIIFTEGSFSVKSRVYEIS